MATRKKKSEKQVKFNGHYCRICGERKDNKKFSGRGYAAHICKTCASKSPAQKSEDMTITKLYGMMFRYLSKTEIKWLKNRRNDNRPEVQELANQIFEEKFPKQARNEIKQKLHVQNIVFHIRGEIFDEYGDECFLNAEYTADVNGMIIRKLFNENDSFIEEKRVDIGQKFIRKLFNVAVHNYDISFWQIDLCHYEISYESDIDLLLEYQRVNDFNDTYAEDDEVEANNNPEENRIPSWSVEIKYKDDMEQKIKGYDCMPDVVTDVFDEFNVYFEEAIIDDEEFNSEEININ